MPIIFGWIWAREKVFLTAHIEFFLVLFIKSMAMIIYFGPTWKRRKDGLKHNPASLDFTWKPQAEKEVSKFFNIIRSLGIFIVLHSLFLFIQGTSALSFFTVVANNPSRIASKMFEEILNKFPSSQPTCLSSFSP